MNQRKTDSPQSGTRFRTERMVTNGGRWYFYTREGSMEGPFETMLDAQDRLEVYIEIQKLELFSGGSELQLQAV
jgi:hypothetical protein